MNVAIIGLFIIPAIVTFMLVALMIKEREYLFPKRPGIKNFSKKEKLINKKSTTKDSQKKISSLYLFNAENRLKDFSGGNLGI